MQTFLNKAVAFLMALFLTMIPTSGIALPGSQTKEADCKLNVAMISDVHLEEKELFRRAFLVTALKNISNAKSTVDSVVIAGDLTNYADEPSLAKYYELFSKHCTVSPNCVISAPGNHDIGHAGDRGVTDITKEQARQNCIDYYNAYSGNSFDKIYYSTTVKGYRFIVLGDEGDRWDAITMSPEQLSWLDEQLAEGTKSGLPVFVVSHWPMDHINGEDMIWDGSSIELEKYDVKTILEKYDNVFYISGHMHAGIKSHLVEKYYGLTNAERVNGVTYLNLPTFGIVNMFGLTGSGTGAQMEVYADKVIFRPHNYLTGKWYLNSEYTFDLQANRPV